MAGLEPGESRMIATVLPFLLDVPLGPIGKLGFEYPKYLFVLLLAIPMAALIYGSKRKIGLPRLVVALTARLLVLLVLALALAGLSWKKPVDDLAVVFVVDESSSVNGSDAEVTAFIQKALEGQQDNDVAGIVAFGADAMLDTAPKAHLEYHGVEARPSPHQSDISAGIRLASAVLPSDRARRVVVFTDGEETRGDAATQALLTAGDDLEISVVPIGGQHGPEALLEDLQAPGRVDEGATFDVRVVARSDEPAKGKLRLYRNDQYLGETEVDLVGGRSQVISIRQQADSAGLYRYRAELEVNGQVDTITQNNEAIGTVQVTGRPRVLYAEGYPEQADHLAKTLRAEGLIVDVVAPGDIPSGPSGLRPYAAVILSDVPAYALTTRQQEGLRAYVRDMGRGLVMVGGDQSFGLGGYYQTPVEEALPVKMDLEDKSRFPKLAMVEAIDKSCSMGDGAGSPLGLAKEAAIETAQLLSERDSLGVIGFDEAASWIVPLQPLTDKPGTVRMISSIRTGGGTDIYPAIQRGNQALAASDAALKHVVVMSDGVTASADFQTLITTARGQGITLSAIAIGDGADRQTMAQLAAWGGGSYYLVTDPTAIPAIFTRETLLASKSFLVEEDFVPLEAANSDLLRGISQSDLHTLHGYVATEPKPLSTVALETPGDHPTPILAHWHYGLGRSVAFTSDCKARWSYDWLGTPEYTKLWTQILRYAIGDPHAGNLQVASEIRDGELEITVDAFSGDGDFRNFLDGQARVIAPDLTVMPVELRQVAPGRYRASVPVDQDGSWLVGVAMQDGEEVVGQSVTEAVQAYSPEFRVGGAGPGVLREIATVGGGGVFTDPALVFARPTVLRDVPKPLWPWLISLAALVMLLDVALRRLELTRPRGAAQTMSLVRAEAAPSRKLVKPPSAAPSPGPLAMPLLEAFDAVAPVPIDEPPAPTDKPPPPADDSYAGQLLGARKRAKKKMDGEP
jgi:uncharacterized membrane protein